MDRRIEDLQLSVRSTNALLNAGIKTVAQLLEQSEQNLRAIDNLGEKSVREILVLIGMLKFYNQQNEWSCVLYRGLDNLIYEDIPLKRLGLPLYLEARLKKNKFRTVGDVDKVELSESTRKANSRFFNNDINAVPKYAFTMGMGTILKSREIIILASGEKKSEALYRAVEGPVSPQWPISALRLHNNSYIVADPKALSQVSTAGKKRFSVCSFGECQGGCK